MRCCTLKGLCCCRQRSRHMKTVPLLVALILAVGCTSAPPPVQSMKSQEADFNSFKTFAWAKDADASAQPLSILDSNVRAAITGELQRKGYTEAAAGTNPDFLLRCETAVAEKIKSNPFTFGIGI